MPKNTNVPLFTTTLTTASSTVSFDLTTIKNIGNFRHLLLEMQTQGTGGATGNNTVFMRFNGVSAGVYSRMMMYGQAASYSGTSSSNTTYISLGNSYESTSLTNYYGAMRYLIPNFQSTTNYKTVIGTYGAYTNRIGSLIGSYYGANGTTAEAITSITLTCDTTTSSNFSVGSSFTLYGIEDSRYNSLASGGFILSDVNYYYHIFTSSGVFTPTTSLSADILVLAGGGGGGGNNGGGGGAGGLLVYSAQSLTAQAYTVTVGAGGSGGSGGANGTNGVNSSFGSLTAAVGGGRGATATTATNGATGGSGGGGYGGYSSNTSTGGSQTTGQGYAGGNGSPSNGSAGGGGGGAGGAGSAGTGSSNDVTAFAGAGGIGATSNFINDIGKISNIGEYISGNYYLAGGGGGGAGVNQGNGGYGGGGYGNNALAMSGLANTGGGGGGSYGNVTPGGGAGGSGLVVVRYVRA